MIAWGIHRRVNRLALYFGAGSICEIAYTPRQLPARLIHDKEKNRGLARPYHRGSREFTW